MTRSLPVHPALSPYVRSIQVEEGGVLPPVEGYKVLPAPFPVLGFQYRGRLEVLHAGEATILEPAGITGLQSSFRTFRGEAATRTVLVTLQPHAAFALTGERMAEFTDGHIGFSQVFSASAARNLSESLFTVTAAEAAIAVVQRFLWEHLQDSKHAPHPLLLQATGILLRHPQVRTKTLAADLHISERQLERLFKQQIGVGPKQFASLTRFHGVMRQLSTARPWTEIAAEAGYSDQAHFIRSFAAYTGSTPGKYVAEHYGGSYKD